MTQLHWNFSTICRDGTDIYLFQKVQVMWAIMQFYDGEIHPYILLKSSNVVWIILFYNIFMQY